MPPGQWTPLVSDSWPGATGWSTQPAAAANATTVCANFGAMLGGDGTFAGGAYAERTLTNMPTHTALRIQLRLFRLNKWSGERLQVLIDGHVGYSSYPQYHGGQHKCSESGYQQEDFAFEIDGA